MTTKRSTWWDTRLRTILVCVGAAVGAVLFLWRIQAAQDDKINANVTSIAVVTTKLDAIHESIRDVKGTVRSLDAHLRRTSTAPGAPVAVIVKAKP